MSPDLGAYCLQYRLPKCISRQESRQQLSLGVGEGLKGFMTQKKEKTGNTQLDEVHFK